MSQDPRLLGVADSRVRILCPLHAPPSVETSHFLGFAGGIPDVSVLGTFPLYKVPLHQSTLTL